MSDDEDSETSLSTDGLDKLMKAMKNPPQLKIGILGDNSPREAGQPNNATVGLWHEFGTNPKNGTPLPVRSFLRMPLITRLDKALKNAGMLEKEYLQQVLKNASFVPVMKKIGVIAEGLVMDAFDTGGFGEWPLSRMGGKTNKQTLVETGQLRNSITSEVDTKS